MFWLISCLALVQPYEAEIRGSLPGNATEFRFEDCRVEDYPEGRVLHVQAYANLKQNLCQWGRCTTVWSYRSSVFGRAIMDDNCDLTAVSIWSVPRNRLLDPLIPRAENAVWQKWPELKKSYPEYCPE